VHTRFSVGRSPRRQKRPKTTQTQRDAAERENRRKRIQNELECWRQARAKDETAYQGIVREAAMTDPSGGSKETYRAMHTLCDRVWVERIHLKKAELAALASVPSPR
jgi:hypothetical protein